MATVKPVHFFDVDSILPGPDRSWSSCSLRIRMVLNYKSIPYQQTFISYPDIAPLLRSLSVAPHRTGRMPYTLPAIICHHPHHHSASASPSGLAIMDSLPIARHLDATYPSPPLFPSGPASHALALAAETLVLHASRAALFLLLPKAERVLDPRGLAYFSRTRAAWFGRPLSELAVTDEADVRRTVDALKAELQIFVTMLAAADDDEPQQNNGKSRGGPFLEGAAPGYADFVLVTFLSWSHRVDLEVWGQIMDMGRGEFRRLWDACLPWMQGQGEEVDPPPFQE